MVVWLGILKDVLLAFTVILLVCVVKRDGWNGLVRLLIQTILYLPGIKSVVSLYLGKEVKGFLKQLGISKDGAGSKIIPIPEKGI